MNDKYEIHVSLTHFADFICKSGTQKITKVKEIKKRNKDGYHPMKDFYKPLRERIIKMHKSGQSKEILDSLAAGQSDLKKRSSYPSAIQGYKKFLGKKNFKWFSPPRELWFVNGLSVSVNPELGLKGYGGNNIIKLYFNSDLMALQRADIINHLMEMVLKHRGANTFAVLDVRRAKFIKAKKLNDEISLLLEAEARNFIRLYRRIKV